MNLRKVSLLEARSIRREVLRPGRPSSEVAYPGDESEFTEHLGVVEDDKHVAVATFLPEICPGLDGAGAWRLRGMATVPSAQGRGLGGQLLSYGVERTFRRGATLIWCYGRTSARTFYERHGFYASGDEFLIPHTGPHYLFTLHRGG